ncbi:MAG TPA: oligosaccharide flippase family protein [Candidatus Acidoferrales bacterium]|nr:oligosaccharide flippase family protein [Candidatus Acidoferrales bacterium]
MRLPALNKTSVLLTLQVVVSGITLFILYRFIYRTLGPVNLGLWSLVLATTGVARFTDLGLSGSLGRFVARYRALNDTPRAVLAVETGVISVIALVTGLGVLAFPILRIALAKVVPHENIAVGLALLPYAVASMIVSSVSGAVQGSLDGCARLDLRAMLAIAGNVIFVTLAVALSHSHGLIGLAWAQLFQAILMAATGWIVLRRILPGVPLVPRKWQKAAFREMIGYSTSYQVAGIAMLLCEPVTKGLLARYGGLADVGLYEMANRVASQFRGLITAPQQSILPMAAAANEKGKRAVVHLYETAVENMSAMLLPTLAVLIASAPLISMLWLGKFNPEFVHLLLALALAVGLQTFIGPAYFSLLGVGSAFWIAAGNMTVGICNLLYALPLAHYYGIRGVVAGSVAALLTGSAVIIIRFHKDYTVPWSIYASKANAFGVPLVAAGLLIEYGIEAMTLGASWSKWAPWAGPVLMAFLAGAVTLSRLSLSPAAKRTSHQTALAKTSEAVS